MLVFVHITACRWTEEAKETHPSSSVPVKAVRERSLQPGGVLILEICF